jgi:ferritin-like metal-binding protein YciE
MTRPDLPEQLTKYLTDAHSIEVQAIEQMRFAPRLAHSPELARIYADHLEQTREHERLVREQLDRRGARPSAAKDVAGRAGGWGMVLFAKANPDTPGKLAAHSHAYEHMELAAYELLRRFAARADDQGVLAMAARIGADERAMADRVAERWDHAVEASLRDKGAEDVAADVVKYLRDAHAIEAQALQLLATASKLVDVPSLADVFRGHLEQSREHQRLLAERLTELGSGPARAQDAALRVGALSLGAFFKAQPDTSVKLAGFAYAFEALEVGAYELLSRTALRAGDEATAALAERILADERAAGERVAATWDDVTS